MLVIISGRDRLRNNAIYSQFETKCCKIPKQVCFIYLTTRMTDIALSSHEQSSRVYSMLMYNIVVVWKTLCWTHEPESLSRHTCLSKGLVFCPQCSVDQTFLGTLHHPIKPSVHTAILRYDPTKLTTSTKPLLVTYVVFSSLSGTRFLAGYS